MKKADVRRTCLLILSIAVVLLSVSCGESGLVKNKLFGRWDAQKVNIDGTDLTMDEIKAMGDDTMDNFYFIIKEGGKAYCHVQDEGDLTDWEEIENGVKIGKRSFVYEGDKLVVDTGKARVYFEKTSDSQIITGDSDKQESGDVAGDTEVEEMNTDDEDMEYDKESSESLNDNEGDSDSGFSLMTSTDKHIQYVNNYTGRNLASFGYTSFGGQRLDRLGEATVQLILVSPDGAFIDPKDEENLKKYVVTGQSVQPNTEVKIEFTKDSQGEEYSNLTDYVSIDVIDLYVSEVGKKTTPDTIAETKLSPDKYTYYVRDYVGKNLASFGYTSLGNSRMDSYGKGAIELLIVADDGAFIDPTDENSLADYVVTGQDVEPNTEIKYEFVKDSNGEEYSNLIDNKSVDAITIYVKKLNS